MEFKEHGPLAQSKEMAEDKNSSWVSIVVMLALGIIIGATFVIRNRQMESIFQGMK